MTLRTGHFDIAFRRGECWDGFRGLSDQAAVYGTETRCTNLGIEKGKVIETTTAGTLLGTILYSARAASLQLDTLEIGPFDTANVRS